MWASVFCCRRRVSPSVSLRACLYRLPGSHMRAPSHTFTLRRLPPRSVYPASRHSYLPATMRCSVTCPIAITFLSSILPRFVRATYLVDVMRRALRLGVSS